MDKQNTVYRVERVSYERRGPHLFCRLPSGRELCYPFIRKIIEDTEYGPQVRLSAIRGHSRRFIWHGTLAENNTQAICADLLIDALTRIDAVGHTHDEVLMEVALNKGQETLEQLEAVMLDAPAWAQGLPLEVESWTGRTFRK